MAGQKIKLGGSGNVYDDNGLHPVDEAEELRRISGISKDEEAQMEQDALDGAAEDGAENVVKEAESAAAGGATASAGEAAEKSDLSKATPESSDGKNSLGTKLKNISNRKKAAAGGGIISIVIAIFGFVATIPALEVAHLAQALTHFHFSAHEQASDDRTSRLFRYLKYRQEGQPQKTRLGILGNIYANRMEKNLKKSGIDIDYSNKFGIGKGWVIDPKNENFKDLDGKSPEEIKSRLAESHGIPKDAIDVGSDGTIRVKAEPGGIKNTKINREINKAMLRQAGYGRVTSALGARVMGKRAGWNWHPMTKIKNKAGLKLEDRLKAWREKRSGDVNNGVDTNINGGNGDNTDKNASKDAIDKADTGDTAAKNKLKKSFANKLLKGVGGATAVAGIACTLRDLDTEAANFKYTNVILPAMRMAGTAIAMGDQVRDGFDMDYEQVKFTMQLMHGEDSSGNKTNWSNAESIQYEEGKQLNGTKPSGTLKNITKDTPFHFLNQGVLSKALGGVKIPHFPDVPGICSALNAPTAVLGFLGINKLTDLLAKPFEPLMEEAMRWLAGKPIDPLAAGGDFGNIVNFGARLSANDQAISDGGTAMSDSEETEVRNLVAGIDQDEFNQKSFAYKMFNPTDNRTLISRIMDKQKPDVSSNVASFTSGLLNVSSSFSSIFSSFFHSKSAHAAVSGADYYGFPKYGYSTGDLNNPLVENPWENAQIVGDILTNDEAGDQKYIKLAQECFGVTLSKTVSEDGTYWSANGLTGQDGKSTNAYDDKKYDPKKCAKKGDNDWLRVRFFIMDLNKMEAYACYSGDQDNQSCVNVGLSGGDVPTANGEVAIVDGFAFPLQTTKSVLKAEKPYVWCFDSQRNCHHDYNAADIFAPTGTQVVAAAPGKVVNTGHKSDGSAATVTILDDKYVYFYQHMSLPTISVKIGDTVTAGQPIGKVGTNHDAFDTPSHLHFDMLPHPPYSSRVGCAAASCTSYPFQNVQPLLTKSWQALPE